MKNSTRIILGCIVAIIVAAVFYFEAGNKNNLDPNLKIHSPEIRITGRPLDTAYLFTDYKDQGAEYLYDSSASLNCYLYRIVTEKTGTVNTHIAGVYHITYYANDTSGNPLTPKTRTVHVVENDAAFLNGAYDVSFSQTITPSGPGSSTLSSGTYTALITSASGNRHFNLYSLNIGPEMLPQDIFIFGDSLEINRFTTDYVSIQGGGRINKAASSFTIESAVYPFSPKVTYKCRNIFTKQLVLNKPLMFTANSSKER